MSNTFGQTIAGGTQDLAAIAGLFCTAGVERNALSVQSGYVAIAVSSLSLLGILGLVRSSIKVALGLQRCSNAGFNLDSLRGLYGFLPEESEPDSIRVECDFTEIVFGKTFLENFLGRKRTIASTKRGCENGDGVIIRRKKRFFDPRITSIVNVGSDWPEKLESKTVINLGNKQRERSLLQSPFLIAAFLFLCPGVTAWLLLVAGATWNWVGMMATLGLHVSLSLLLAVPIWHGRNMTQPATHMSVDVWNLLTCNRSSQQSEQRTDLDKVNFLHARIAHGDVLHMLGDRKYLDSERIQGLVLIPAATCALAYVCQYAVLTKATNRQSLIWVGCQAILALLRLLFWILDPQFDNPGGLQTEYAVFNNTQFGPVTLMEMSCAAGISGENEIKIPSWALEYLLTTDLKSVLVDATPDSPPTEEARDVCILLNIDFERVLRHRKDKPQPGTSIGNLWRLGLERLKDDKIRPFIVIEMQYTAEDGSATGDKHQEWLEQSWARAVANSQGLLVDQGQNSFTIKHPCHLSVFNQQGTRIHLRPIEGQCPNTCPFSGAASTAREDRDSWTYLCDRSDKVCALLRSMAEKDLDIRCVNTWCDALWTVATPGIVDRKGNTHPSRATTTRTWGNGNNVEMAQAIESVGEYIGKAKKDTV